MPDPVFAYEEMCPKLEQKRSHTVGTCIIKSSRPYPQKTENEKLWCPSTHLFQQRNQYYRVAWRVLCVSMSFSAILNATHIQLFWRSSTKWHLVSLLSLYLTCPKYCTSIILGQLGRQNNIRPPSRNCLRHFANVS